MLTPPPAPSFDAFGDVAAPVRPRVTSSKRARTLTVAVFWSVAMVLIAGRVYQADVLATPAQTIAMASR